MTQDQQANANGQSQALTPYQARAMELREEIGQDTSPRAIVPRTFAEAQAFASAISQSTLVPEALRNRAPDVLMMVLAGAELEIPPIRALSLFHVIEGVPKLSADGLAGKVQASPLCEYLEPIEQSDTRVTWRGKRRGRPELTVSYTFAEAERAGLTGPTRSGRPSNWMKHPTDMLNARCKARVCRLLWPDLCAGLVTAEEAFDMLGDAPAAPSSSFAAPPPPPSSPPAGNSAPATASNASAPANKGKSTSKAAANKAAPIDTTATESTSTSSNSPPTSVGSSSSVSGSSQRGSAATSTDSPSASSTPSSNSSPESDTAPGVIESSSPVDTSGPSVPAEDGSGFGDDDPPPANNWTIEKFEEELAAVVKSRKADGLSTVKAKWLPWSKEDGPTGGKQHAQRMRQAFAKAQSELGIK